jgi:tetratricopeptide (TPR) repeat protein/DNA-binding CsgD family transcriptional regulator
MKNRHLHSPTKIYTEYVNTINTIHFTQREIDVISFLISGRSTKKIAAFFSISPKTVEYHTHKIMQKLSCNSRDSIIDFIERSDKFPCIKEYYASLLFYNSYEKMLGQIGVLTQAKSLPTCSLFCWQEKETDFPHFLQEWLNQANIKTHIKLKKENEDVRDLIKKTSLQEGFNIFLISHTQMNLLLTLEPETRKFLQQPKVLFFLDKNQEEYFSKEIIKEYGLVFYEKNNPIDLCLSIVKRSYQNEKIDQIIEKFKNQHENYEAVPANKLPLKEVLNNNLNNIRLLNFPIKKKITLLMGVLSFFILILYIKKTTERDEISVRSDFVIPTETVLLQRPELIDQIKNNLKGNEEIQTVALIGPGGAGKTTLARQYAKLQTAKIIWEINAETYLSLASSFESLAYSLATTEADKYSLKALQEIKNPDQREKQIVQFVKNHLRKAEPWLLIYDNVSKMASIENYFPIDSKTWGQGKVLLTTQDETLKNNHYITHTIQIEELSEMQKNDLFLKILYKDKPSSQKILNQVATFLKKIPPFPLDVSVTAYYLKATNLSFNDYLDRFNLSSEDFDKAQQEILNESSSYKKTRYSIITLTLQKIISAHKDFQDLLLLICLLDSRDIPRELLDIFKDKITVDRFIHNLKKFSLITDASFIFIDSFPQFSIHKNTQKIGFTYFIKSLNLMKDEQKLQSITNTLEKYLNNINEKREVSKIKNLINHSEAFLSHSSSLTEKMKWTIIGQLGEMYCLLGYHKKGEQFLDETLRNFDKAYLENKGKIAPLLNKLGNIYRELGNYEKSKDSLERGLLIYKTEFPQNSLGAAQALGGLGILHRALGNYEKAKEHLENSLILYKKSFSENHPDATLALTSLGIIYWDLGNYQKAKDLLGKSLSIYKQHFPNNYNDMAWVLTYLGGIYRDLGDYEKARAFLEEGLGIYRKHFPNNYIAIARILTYLGDVYRDSGQYLNAKEALEQSQSIYKKYYPENHDGLAWVTTYLGVVYKDLGEYKKALELFNMSSSIYKKSLGENNIITIRTQVQVGNCYRLLGDYERAVKILERNLSIYKQILGEKHSMAIAWISMHLGNAYGDSGNSKKAKKLLTNSLSVYEDNYGNEHVRTAEILRCLGQVHILEGEFEDAESLITKALDIYQKNNHQESYKCLENLADLQIKRFTGITNDGDSQTYNFKAQAINFLKLALKTAEIYFPADSPHIGRIQSKIKAMHD